MSDDRDDIFAETEPWVECAHCDGLECAAAMVRCAECGGLIGPDCTAGECPGPAPDGSATATGKED